MEPAHTEKDGLPDTTGEMWDDVVGEVHDKTGCTPGPFHFGGKKTDETVYEGKEMTYPLCVTTKEDNHDPSPSGPKSLATNIAYNVC